MAGSYSWAVTPAGPPRDLRRGISWRRGGTIRPGGRSRLTYPSPSNGPVPRRGLVLFPTLYEGFGFVPFEAAALGTAPVYANRSAMAELLPAEGMLPSFDLDEAGAFVVDLLGSIDARARLVEAISETAAELTWDRTAVGYRAVYDRALGRPRRELGDLLRASLELTRRTQLTQREASLLAIYRRRRSARLAADSIVHVGTKLTSGMRTILGRQRTG